jgi:hypothetical protein
VNSSLKATKIWSSRANARKGSMISSLVRSFNRKCPPYLSYYYVVSTYIVDLLCKNRTLPKTLVTCIEKRNESFGRLKFLSASMQSPREGNVCLSMASSVVKEETQDNGKVKASLDVNLAVIVTDNDIPTLVGECLATSLWTPVFSWKPLTGSATAVNDILGIGSDLGT